MKFLTQAIKFMPATGRGSSFRLAEHPCNLCRPGDKNPCAHNRFVIVFDEDMDMRVMIFLKHLFTPDVSLAQGRLQLIGERKGAITVVFKADKEFDITDIIKREVEDALTLTANDTGDSWGYNVYISFSNEKLWDNLFYPFNNPKETKAAVFAALQIARNLKTTEVIDNE